MNECRFFYFFIECIVLSHISPSFPEGLVSEPKSKVAKTREAITRRELPHTITSRSSSKTIERLSAPTATLSALNTLKFAHITIAAKHHHPKTPPIQELCLSAFTPMSDFA